MRHSEVSRRYSFALFELGKEEDKLSVFRAELASVLRIMEEYPDLKKLLLHPRIRREDKKLLLERVFSEELSKELLNFLKLLTDRRRESYLEAIYKDYLDLLNKEENILEVEVRSAISLPEDLKARLAEKLAELTGTKISIKEKVDPEIIGGLVLKIGDRVIDGSIRKDLEALKNRLVQIPVS
ncbi:MAG: ATP synthase F1 subunit delta [Halanaerobiaceae bacterium]|nr:ATP synthase F1 subunit delta [Halanaerobiaceae bacterium]